MVNKILLSSHLTLFRKFLKQLKQRRDKCKVYTHQVYHYCVNVSKQAGNIFIFLKTSTCEMVCNNIYAYASVASLTKRLNVILTEKNKFDFTIRQLH